MVNRVPADKTHTPV